MLWLLKWEDVGNWNVVGMMNGEKANVEVMVVEGLPTGELKIVFVEPVMFFSWISTLCILPLFKNSIFALLPFRSSNNLSKKKM